MRISDKQERMLAFIESFVAKHGYPPTYEEIRAGLDISTKSLVDYHLNVLEKANFITRIPNTPRGLRLTCENSLASSAVAAEPQTYESQPKDLVLSLLAEQLVEPNELDDDQVLELTYDTVTNGCNMFAIKINGNSLKSGFADEGDIVILQRQPQLRNGEVVAVRLLDQDKISVGKYHRENGHIRLTPSSGTMKEILVSPEALEVKGKVVAIIRQVDQLSIAG